MAETKQLSNVKHPLCNSQIDYDYIVTNKLNKGVYNWQTPLKILEHDKKFKDNETTY